MTPTICSAALEHAIREMPREACGLVVAKDGVVEYRPCRNLAETEIEFILDPADYARAEDEGEILAIVHSHPNASANPSQADRVACERSGLPWWIVSVPGGVWRDIAPSGYRAPLVGREFSYGVNDCWSLIRDWYREDCALELMDFERPEKWWERGGNMYVENYERAGFRRLAEGEPLERGDIIMMQIRSKVPNHAGVYLGDGKILHHLQGRLSSREIYGGFYKKVTRLAVRYQGAS